MLAAASASVAGVGGIPIGFEPAPGETDRVNTKTDGKLRTTEELAKLSPTERTIINRAGTATDVAQIPDAFLERVQANVHDHITATESAVASER